MPVDYAERERSYELFVKGKQAGTWDPDEFDIARDREDWAEFTEAERSAFLLTCAGFYDGEEDVTRTLAPYMLALDRLDPETVTFDPVQQEMYLSQQVYEEAKHTDFFSRYFEEVFGTQETEPLREGGYQEAGYSTEDLYDTADALVEAATSGDQRRIRHELAESDPEVVPEVLEPRLKVYVRDRVLSAREVNNPFEGYDQEYVGDRSLRYLQDTVDAVGADRFEDLTDVRAYVERAQEEGADAAAADDD